MTKFIAVLSVLSASIVGSYAVLGQHHSHQTMPKQHSTEEQASLRENKRERRPGRIELPLTSLAIPDFWLLDQNGKRVRFYTDLVKGKVVVVNFFFTKCSDVCPMQGRSLSRLKDRLAGRLGRNVFFISISKDPDNDTPEKLTKWGREYGVSSGWKLVTGQRSVIKKLLWDFTGEEIGQAMHESMVVIGNDRTGVWTATDGLLLPEDLVKVIDDISRSDSVLDK